MSKAFGDLCGAIFLIAAWVFTLAFAAVHIWGWYLVPAFNVPPLSYKAAVGIVLAFLIVRIRPGKQDEIDTADRIAAAAAAWFVISIAWAVQAVMP